MSAKPTPIPEPEPVDLVARLDAVGKTYRMGCVDVPALRNVDLSIRHGRFTFIIGPSGSGKTTLLNLLGCVDRPSAGTLTILNTDVGSLDDDALSDFRARSIGYIFQSFNLIPVLSAFENVEYPLILARMPARERRSVAREMLDAVGLADRADHRPNQLSGGQRQRVAIARALGKRPALVLADEPTANLDSRTSAEIVELMRRIQERWRTTFIFSSHDPDLMRHADETHHLVDGSLL